MIYVMLSLIILCEKYFLKLIRSFEVFKMVSP